VSKKSDIVTIVFLCEIPVLKYFQKTFGYFTREFEGKKTFFFQVAKPHVLKKTLTRGQKTLTPPYDSFLSRIWELWQFFHEF